MFYNKLKNSDITIDKLIIDLNTTFLLFRRRYIDPNFICNLFNSIINCLEILSLIPFNVPKVHLRFHSLFHTSI